MLDLYIRRAKVERVVDGDTLDLLVDLGYEVWVKERVRLARIDAPEVRGVERESGLAAKEFVEKMLLLDEIDFITVKTTRHKGKYGRYIAEIEFEVEGETVNLSDMMMAEGHAEEYK